MFYKDIHHHADKINNYIHGKGNKVYFAGGKFGAPDLKNKNYKTNHLMIYDPSEGSGGDFGQEAYTSAWRKAHEQAHHETYPEINKIYGEGRRLGKMGVRSPNEMLRAVHWEDLAVNRQRDIMKGLGYNMSDEDFNRERNTVLTDAVTRAISGKFSDPSQEGFVPHSHHIPLEHYLDVLNEHANKLGLGRHDTFASKSKLAANELVESSLNK